MTKVFSEEMNRRGRSFIRPDKKDNCKLTHSYKIKYCWQNPLGVLEIVLASTTRLALISLNGKVGHKHSICTGCWKKSMRILEGRLFPRKFVYRIFRNMYLAIAMSPQISTLHVLVPDFCATSQFNRTDKLAKLTALCFKGIFDFFYILGPSTLHALPKICAK